MTWTLAFDADDTLWHNENLYADTQQQLFTMLRPYAEEATLHSRLLETERLNLRLFGYGVKGFTLSMIETAIQISHGKVSAAEIQVILEAGKTMLAHRIELLPHVRETLTELGLHHNLMMITKGDLFHQESRIAMSGLGDLFSAVEVVSEKDDATYRKVFHRYHLNPENFVMVGNSVRSDIQPVLALGARAIYIPYAVTWEHEQGHLEASDRWQQAASIAEVPELLQRFETRK